MIEVGDYLQQGLHFYRIYDVGKDIVMNQILYHPKYERLQMTHVYSFAELNEIGEGKKYILHKGNSPELKIRLEWIKRKYKLEKLNNINNE